ncbi:MAG: asparagine synthase-related protein [Acidobacteria bacterium]|nr:asparagine synthase-related protein [Acidobacteriota bacterium]
MTSRAGDSDPHLKPWLGCVTIQRPPEPGDIAAGRYENAVSLGSARFCLPTNAALPPVSIFRNDEGLAFFSGYLLNRDDVVAELSRQEGSPEPSDAELAWQAYSRWGSESFLKLQGLFAAAVWDERSRRFHMARDSGGLHPLFYWLQEGRLLFSWSVHEILRQPGVSKALNRVVLAEHLASRWIDSEETFWEGISRVPAGHGVDLSASGKRVYRYWDPMPEGRPIEWVNEDELREFPDLLQKAVERTLRFGQAGILLSGGFDSVSIAAVAADWAGRGKGPLLKAYSLRFSGDGDEVAVQLNVARQLGLTQHFEDLATYERDPGLAEGSIATCGELPSPTTMILKPAYNGLLSLAREQGCKVVLTGEGGDEWLTVTPVYAADLIANGQFLRLARLVRMALRFWTLPVLPAIRNIVWSNGLRLLLREHLRRLAPGVARARRRSLLAIGVPDWLAPDPELRRELTQRFRERWHNSQVTDSYYIDRVRASLSEALFEQSAEERFFRDLQAEMPTLHPYLDRDLVEFLLRVPPELLIRGGQSKALVREAMESRFPDMGFAKQKKVTARNSFLNIYGREVSPAWRKLGRLDALERLGVVDAERAGIEVNRWLASSILTEKGQSWNVSSAEAWVRAQE